VATTNVKLFCVFISKNHFLNLQRDHIAFAYGIKYSIEYFLWELSCWFQFSGDIFSIYIMSPICNQFIAIKTRPLFEKRYLSYFNNYQCSRIDTLSLHKALAFFYLRSRYRHTYCLTPFSSFIKEYLVMRLVCFYLTMKIEGITYVYIFKKIFYIIIHTANTPQIILSQNQDLLSVCQK